VSVPRSERGSTRLSLSRDAGLPAQRLVNAPTAVRRIAAAIVILTPIIVVLLLLIPWQQSATGTGRVIAWAPENRQQPVESPIDGRLVSWQVQEGDAVAAGETLVLLEDNDPNWLARLQSQLEAAGQAQAAATDQVISYEAKLAAAIAGRELALAEYDAKIAGLRQKRVSDGAELDAASVQEGRILTLRDEGISSSRSAELASMKARKAEAAAQARDAEISAVQRAREKAGADADAKIAGARAELEAARGKVAEARQKQIELESKVARQSAQSVKAPRDGIVLAVHGGAGGGQVKKGQLLVTLVPATTDRAVELWIDGNDMPLLQRGDDVRLLFEGWPALQFVGLPGGSTGTFAGIVSWIDPADNGKGKFRVVVLPDAEELAWPAADRLRQGVRAKGFVLLSRVPLGYELWRQVNGFPPIPDLDKGTKPDLPTNKKPRAPSELK
jgi:adhesin transport system membrane fusion protein